MGELEPVEGKLSVGPRKDLDVLKYLQRIGNGIPVCVLMLQWGRVEALHDVSG